MKSFLAWLGLTSVFSVLLFSFVLRVGQDSTASSIQSTSINSSIKITKSDSNLNPMQIERYIRIGDFNSLRKISRANRTIVKKYLLNDLDQIDKDYIQRLRSIDLKLGNFVETSKSILKNKNSAHIITPLAMISSDYIYDGLLEDQTFIEFYKEKSIELFLEYRRENKNDILGAFSLLNQTEISTEVEKEVKLLFLQLIKAPLAIRALVEESFIDSYDKLASNNKLRKYLEYALMSYSLDNIENEEKVNLYLNKMKELNPDSKFVAQFNETILDKSTLNKSMSNDDKARQMANESSKETSSFLDKERFTDKEGNEELGAKKSSSFSFGLFLLIATACFYLYKRIRKPFRKDKNYLKETKEEEIEFDEDLSLDLG